MSRYELVSWQDIKEDFDYPEDDNNNGYVYGVNWYDDNLVDILEVDWYKTPEERQKATNGHKIIFE